MPVTVPVSPVTAAKTSLLHTPKKATLATSKPERQNTAAMANFVPSTSRASGSASTMPLRVAFLRVKAFFTQSVNGF